MSLADTFFGDFYEKGKSGGKDLSQEAGELIRYGTLLTIEPLVAIWDRLNYRDQNGNAIGILAYERDRGLAQLSLRLNKMFSPRYGRRLQPA